MSAAYSNSSRALAFLSETSEDAIATLKGLVGGVGSAKYLDTSEDKLSTIATQIDSSRDEDRIAALTRIVAMISKGRDASSFLPAVLKLTSSSNLDVRKLVYIVLLRYANSNPDLTLLSINSFQRDLSDPSPLIRAMALRVLSSIKVSMVAPIVIMAVTKASRDPNLYVRKIAALAIPKCHQIDRSQLDSLQEVLATLLADRSPYVLGAALSAFQRMCPTNWQLLHQNYRRICHALSDMDEWGQITAIQVLSRYARANLVQPPIRVRSTPDISYIVLLNILAIARQHRYLFAPHVTSFLLGPSHEEPLFLSLLKLDVLVAVCNTGNLDLVLTEIASHMRSADASIAAHAVSCLGELALSKELEAGSRCLAILLDLLRKRKSGPRIHDSTIARAVLVIKNLLQLSSLTGEHAVESKRTSAIVYRLAALLFGTPPKSAEDKSKRKTKPKVIGKGAIMHPDARASIIWLLGQHARSSISVSTPAAAALPNGQGQESKTLAELVIPDVLRRCALNFANESPVVKLQILTMSSKAFAFLPTVLMSTPALGEGGKGRGEGLAGTVTTLHFYLLKLARYDANFDVRDRARFLKGLTAPLITQKMVVGEGEGATEDTIQGAIEAAARAMGEGSTEDGDADLKGVRLRREQVIHVLFEGKLPSTTTDTTVTESDATGGPELASLSLVLGGKLVKGWLDTILPPWTTTPTPSALREPPAAQSTQTTLQNTSLANAKSFSSSDFSSLPVSMPVTLTPKGAVTPTSKGSTTPIELEAGTTSVQTQQRYKDLDSFLDESDEDEVQQPYLDDSAPEDEEFAAGEDVWDDDDEEEEDEEDSSSEEDDE
uniref:Clathrin/coatomer adaptor adaptin-like N-terminal domain-containing protein n=1 Tax=Kalmanozyma brasiliensis (strain GHG001) TaxID=1365824 RepID=V5EJN3_KALBG